MIELIIKSEDGNRVVIEQGKYVFAMLGVDDTETNLHALGRFNSKSFIASSTISIDKFFDNFANNDEYKASDLKYDFIKSFADMQLKKQ